MTKGRVLDLPLNWQFVTISVPLSTPWGYPTQVGSKNSSSFAAVTFLLVQMLVPCIRLALTYAWLKEAGELVPEEGIYSWTMQLDKDGMWGCHGWWSTLTPVPSSPHNHEEPSGRVEKVFFWPSIMPLANTVLKMSEIALKMWLIVTGNFSHLLP